MEATATKTRAKVAVTTVTRPLYPRDAPYHPACDYPEYPFKGHLTAETNEVYAAVRELLWSLGLDEQNYGTAVWNPLRHLIEPGMKVVIKPNFVLSRHPRGEELFSIITHPSVLRAIADYCWIALRGSGSITIADAPQYNCNFDELLEATKLDEVCDFYAGFPGPVVDFTDLRSYWSAGRHLPSCRRPLAGDPQGTVVVDLGHRSALCDCPNPQRFYGAVYHRDELIGRHSNGRHEYEVSSTMLGADAFISVPKLKVHKKVGVTLNLKGLVGICTNKNLCLHYRLGPPSRGGDQYPDGLFTPLEEWLIRLERWMYDHLLARRSIWLEYVHRSVYRLHGALLKPLGITVPQHKRIFDAGNWHGNDSAWRMVADLLKVFYFTDPRGRLHRRRQRRAFSIVDGVIAGENNGPLSPDAKPAGVLLAGENILAVDLVATRLMGFDPLKLKMFRAALTDPDFDYGVRALDEINVVGTKGFCTGLLSDTQQRYMDFKPHPGWAGHIEISS